jgi:hypothetical protein
MSTVRIYGASDDLIEIDGDLSEEFGAYDSDPVYLGFSDGTLLNIRYDNDGNWRIVIAARGAGTEVKVTAAMDRHEGCYSDEAVLIGDLRWVVKGTEFAS